MNRQPMSVQERSRRPLLLCALALGLTAAASAQTRTYTNDADFLEGTLLNLVLDPPDQLQLGSEGVPFPFISVSKAGTGTMVRIDAATGEILGEYLTAPAGEAQDPSRATVDLLGNSWIGNRAEDAAGVEGSVVQVGVIIGGTRVDANGQPDPNGEYLAPPYDYTTVVDRDGDGLIRTSNGDGNVLAWPNITDGDGGIGGTAALVEDAEDEVLRIYQKTVCPNIRHLTIDGANDIWVGGYPGFPTCFQRLSGVDGSFLGPQVLSFGFCGGYGGLVDGAGVIWSVSPFEDSLMTYEPADPPPPMNASNCISVMPNPRGVAADSAGNLWVAGSGEVQVYDAAGNPLATYPIPNATFLHGIAVHPADQHVWVADSNLDEVFRLDPSGTVLATIPVGLKPNGVAVDGNGMVWVCNEDSDDIFRIDPATDAVDLMVDLGLNAKPFNPSDMTGTVAYTTTLESGLWKVTADGGQPGTDWFNVSWSEFVPVEGSLLVFVRSSDDEAALEGLPWVPATNNGGISQPGQFLQVQAEFEKDPNTNESPILFDLTVEGQNGGNGGPCDEVERRRPGSLLLYPEFDNRAGVVTILSLTHVDCDAEQDLAVEFMYIDEEDCLEFNRTEILTPCDTVTLLTGAHNPNQERGYVYVFAKDARTGDPVVANALIGSLLVVNGLQAFEYGLNPVDFEGIGDGTLTDLDADGLRDLDGLEYSMAPDTILVPRFLGQGGFGGGFHSELILIGLSGGVQFTTTVDFLIYNDNEETFSGAHTFYCWDKVPLLAISGIFENDFLRDFTNQDPGEILGAPSREAGWFRIDGAVANSTLHTIIDPAFYAVLVERVGDFGVADLPFESCSQDNGSLLPSGLHGE